MNTIEVTEKLSVSVQPQLQDFASLKAQGFTTVINNRLDGEEPAQPASAAEEDAAWAAGLAYVHIPVTSTNMTGRGRPALQGRCRSCVWPGARTLPQWRVLLLSPGPLHRPRGARRPGDAVIEPAPLTLEFVGEREPGNEAPDCYNRLKKL